MTPLRRAAHKGARFIFGRGSANGLFSRTLRLLEKNACERVFAPIAIPRLRKVQYTDLSADLGIPEERIYSADHHICHAFSALYFAPVPEGRTVVLTMDGAGDDLCSTVSVSEDGTLSRVAQTPSIYSLGVIYMLTTALLGMEPNEHEYKVMGLAPYADTEGVEQVLPVFEELLRVDGLSFVGPSSAVRSAPRCSATGSTAR